MSAFAAFNLAELMPPDAVEERTFDEILQDIVSKFKTDNPELASSLDLESEPLTALLQAFAYHLYVHRAYINQSMQAVMLAYSSGADLDHLAALVPVRRLEGESDDALRARVRLAPEGFSTAGPIGAYEFHARSTSGSVLDVFVDSPTPGVVDVYILEDILGGNISNALIAQIQSVFDNGEIRPLVTNVVVKPAGIVSYNITAELVVKAGYDPQSTLALATDKLNTFSTNARQLGQDIHRSAVIAALHVDGVEKVELLQPAGDVVVAPHEAALLGQVNITEGSNA